MTKLLIGSAAALAVAMVPAFAQPAPPTPPGVASGTAAPTPVPLVRPVPPMAERMHMRIMSDRVMTRDEVVRHVHEFFGKLDTNHDGFITHEELEAFHQKMTGMEGMGREMAQRFREHPLQTPDRAAMFDKLDTNHDGVISRQEYMAAQPRVRERQVFIMRDGSAPGGPGQPGMARMIEMHGHGAGMHMGGFGGHLFEMADTNHDGRVSLQEAEAAALAHFDKADLNHDGKITPDEREQAHQMLRGHRPS
jgi:Ca2+-binding EF-hand superfamily protein